MFFSTNHMEKIYQISTQCLNFMTLRNKSVVCKRCGKHVHNRVAILGLLVIGVCHSVFLFDRASSKTVLRARKLQILCKPIKVCLTSAKYNVEIALPYAEGTNATAQYIVSSTCLCIFHLAFQHVLSAGLSVLH